MVAQGLMSLSRAQAYRRYGHHQEVQLGPFTGGLNTFSDISSISDNELSVCENFDIDFDGSLVSRPPFVDSGVPLTLSASGGQMTLLGYYYAGGVSNTAYLIASDGYSSTYYFTGSSWTLITNTFAATAMLQFRDSAWLLASPTAANNGGYWTPAGGFTAVADLPRGDTIAAYKNRLFVSAGKDSTTNSTRVYFSNTPDVTPFWPTLATSDRWYDIGRGDGQPIVKIVPYYSSLLVFKRDSIWAISYATDPFSASPSIVVPNIGLDHVKALTVWENYLYFTYDGRAFEFINNRATQINIRVPFVADSTANINPIQALAVSRFNNRILFSYYDRQYVFGLRTRAWTVWKSPTLGPVGELVVTMNHDGAEDAVALQATNVAAGSSRSAKLLKIVDTASTNAESFNCTFETKNYNYNASAQYKRLFWWGLDGIFRGTITASAIPVTFNKAVYWSQIASSTWATLNTFTWDQPTSPSSSEDTVVATGGTSAVRKFVKLNKALRFRQIRFRAVLSTDGSSSSAPVRVFGLMTYLRTHEHVAKGIT